MMRAYSIFDDYTSEAISILENAGIEVVVHPKGLARPAGEELKTLIEKYDILIISTAQKMPESYFENIFEKRIIATASSGIDHISIPQNKRDLVSVVNAPIANRISVAEHTFALIFSLAKNLEEGKIIASQGLNKNQMVSKPFDLFGKTIGVVGVGGMGSTVLRYADAFSLKKLAWTRFPEKHGDVCDCGVCFADLKQLFSEADIISVNLPSTTDTKGIITKELIDSMKPNAIFISTSRPDVTDNVAVFNRAKENPEFMVGMDVDANAVNSLWNFEQRNVIVTPHIAGGTVESRKRLFAELSNNIVINV